MTKQSEIDAALHWIGSATPAEDMEERIQQRLRASRVGWPMLYSVSVIAIAASLAIVAIVLSPLPHQLLSQSAMHRGAIPRADSHAFGGASAVHVPTVPVPIAPTPVGQGRGHERAPAPSASNAKKPSPASHSSHNRFAAR